MREKCGFPFADRTSDCDELFVIVDFVTELTVGDTSRIPDQLPVDVRVVVEAFPPVQSVFSDLQPVDGLARFSPVISTLFVEVVQAFLAADE